jgi:hypothetical protein
VGRDLERGQRFTDPLPNIAGRQIGPAFPHNHGNELLTEDLVVNTDVGLIDVGMLDESVLDLDWVHIFAASDDQVSHPALYVEQGAVDAAEVTGATAPIECRRVRS